MRDLVNTIKYLIYVVINHPLRLLSINFIVTSLLLEYLKNDYCLFVIIGCGMLWGFTILKNQRANLLIILVFSILIPIIIFNWRRKEIIEKSELLSNYLFKDDTLFATIISDPEIDHDTTRYTVEFLIEDGLKSENIRLQVRGNKYPIYYIGDSCLITIRKSRITNEEYLTYLHKKGIIDSLNSENIVCHSTNYSFGSIFSAKTINKVDEKFDELEKYDEKYKTQQNFLTRFFRLTQINMYKLKRRISSVIENNIVEPYASLWAGIIFGDDRLFSEDMNNSFMITQTTHIIAASGFNISVIVSSVSLVGKKFLKMKPRNLLIIILSFIYCFFANLSGSILRAFIMSSFRCLARVFGYKYNPIDALLYSMVILSFTDINPVTNIGYILSASATIGTITLYPRFKKLFEKFKFRFFKSNFFENFLLSFSCSISTYPFIHILLGSGSLLGVISNIFVLDITELVFYNGVITIFLCSFTNNYVVNKLSDIFLTIQYKFLWVMTGIIKFFGLVFSNLTFNLYVNRILIVIAVFFGVIVIINYIKDISFSYQKLNV